MNWFNKFLTSSIGNKALVATTGLFLILFLIVHLLGNLQLLIHDDGESFIAYSEIMGNNLLIKVIAYILYISIIVHAYKGMVVWMKNRKARGTIRYAVKSSSGTPWASRNMAWLGILILIFIVIHMAQFWFAFKFTSPEAHFSSPEDQERWHYLIIQQGFSNLWVVIFYVVGNIALAWHLAHGFQSAFQTFGLRRGKYTGMIRGIGLAFAIIVPLLFAVIPILMYNGLYPLGEFRVIPGQ